MSALLHAKYRNDLPQLTNRLFLTDGGIETTLIFHDDWKLPENAAFVLIDSLSGYAALAAYFERYIPLAVSRGAGFVLESPTWRSNPDWGARIGYNRVRLAQANRDCLALMGELRAAHETKGSPMPISGCIGPRGDGYDPGKVMSAAEAEDYHGWQAEVFANAGVDLISAITMTNINEAIGVARAAKSLGVPAAISFTVETDGRLPTGDLLKDAIEAVDAATNASPAYYMINCAHPTHFDRVLEEGAAWTRRIKGLRANSSRCSHADLDNAPTLDMGDPAELGDQYAELRWRFPHITVLGGCCGTDHRHIEAIGKACMVAA